MHRFSFLLVAVISAMFLSACDEVQIFENQTDPTALTPVSNSELEEDTYYVKNGTKFFKTYQPKGSVGFTDDSPEEVDESRVLTVINDSTLIPPYYKSEILAYFSEKKSIDGITLERYQSLGYSLGTYNGELTENGIVIDFNKNVCEDSSLREAIVNDSEGDRPANNKLIISAINGEEISKLNFDISSGVILGLEKGKQYTVSYFEGTKYHEIDVIADTLMLQAFELYPINNDINRTSNGYIEFSMPSAFKSGYYSANNSGLFQYFDYARGEKVDSEEDMNIPYFDSELDKLAAYSRQYTIQVPNKVKNLKIEATYNDKGFDKSLIKGYVFSPSGEKYDMTVDTKEDMIYSSFSEAGAGTWTVNIIPKSLDIEDVKVDKDELKRALTVKETNIVFDNDTENVLFECEYQNEDAEINGVIISESGDTWTMKKEKIKEHDKNKNKEIERYFLRYNANYVAAGTYSVKIYYDVTSTEISDITTKSTTENETDVFVIEE